MEAVLSAPPAEVTSEQTQLARMVMERAVFQRVLLSSILQGSNPRTYFDPVETAQMDASAREQGIIQPIILRLKGDQYYIVAGERRYRSACNVMHEGYEIPAMVVEMTDEEAKILSAVENTAREDMSPTEEAVAAANVLGTTMGDRDLAAKTLGWSRNKLENRLALMNCTEAVRTALNHRQINLGHAELLAALSKSSQEKFLPVIINEKRTVAEIKQVISQAACKLDSAIFDKEQCLSCPHNSSLQKSFFAENIGDGGCTNRTCYNEKTENALNEKVVQLKDDYPVVRIIRIGDNSTSLKLVANGPAGVGTDQAQACRGCADFGAGISALPDAMGEVYKDRCFNPTCNANMVAARIKSDNASTESASSAESTATATTTSSSDGAALKKQSAPEKKPTSVTESDRIKSYREKVWRDAMKREIAASPEISGRYLIAICMSGNGRNINGTALSLAFTKIADVDKAPGTLPEKCKSLELLNAEQITKMTTLLAASAMSEIDVAALKQLAAFHQLDLSKYWKLDTEFLDLLTKSEIEVIATELGLHKQFGDDFKKLFSEKKADLIKKLLGIKDFNYSEKIPKVLRP